MTAEPASGRMGSISRKRQTPLWSAEWSDVLRSRQRVLSAAAAVGLDLTEYLTSSRSPQWTQRKSRAASAKVAPQPMQRSSGWVRPASGMAHRNLRKDRPQAAAADETVCPTFGNTAVGLVVQAVSPASS